MLQPIITSLSYAYHADVVKHAKRLRHVGSNEAGSVSLPEEVFAHELRAKVDVHVLEVRRHDIADHRPLDLGVPEHAPRDDDIRIPLECSIRDVGDHDGQAIISDDALSGRHHLSERPNHRNRLVLERKRIGAEFRTGWPCGYRVRGLEVLASSDLLLSCHLGRLLCGLLLVLFDGRVGIGNKLPGFVVDIDPQAGGRSQAQSAAHRRSRRPVHRRAGSKPLRADQCLHGSRADLGTAPADRDGAVCGKPSYCFLVSLHLVVSRQRDFFHRYVGDKSRAQAMLVRIDPSLAA